MTDKSTCIIEIAELTRLRKIEAAARAWRKSLEDDNWTKEAIEADVCRPGMSDLMKLVGGSNGQSAPQT